jgi:uncharacterized protein YcfJ
MKTKSWIANVLGLAIASLVLVAGNASAADYAYGGSRAVYDYAKVLNVKPVVRYVTVTTPVKECWEDVEYYTRTRAVPGRAGKTLFGAIVGGVIGHQFGSGSGNDAATVAGTLIGAAVANGSDNRPYYRTNEYSRPVRRCETNYQSHKEERIDGYDVIYQYHGQKYSTRMPYDPGRKLKIRVDVRPAA